MKNTIQKILLAWIGITLLSTQAVAADNTDMEMLERGKYILKIGGCNDCHTSGYIFKDGNIPEAEWLKGDSLGWKGPWGTTYATNLREQINQFSEDGWVEFARTFKARPPMPWFTVNQMHEKDLRAIYHFVNKLGPAKNAVPAYLPPDKETPQPYVLFPPPPKE